MKAFWIISASVLVAALFRKELGRVIYWTLMLLGAFVVVNILFLDERIAVWKTLWKARRNARKTAKKPVREE